MLRRLHNEKLHSLYRSPNTLMVIKSRRLRWAGNVARMEEGKSVFKILTSKPTGDILLGRPRHRWEDKIRTDMCVNTRNFNWFGKGQELLECPCECGIETPGSISLKPYLGWLWNTGSYIKIGTQAKSIWKQYLERNICLKGMRILSGEGYTMRDFIVCTVHLI